MADKYGLKAATRFGLGILRSNAVAKNDQHKNSKHFLLNRLSRKCYKQLKQLRH
jgi:hypothetical protein